MILKRTVFQRCPTKHFTITEPLPPSIDVSDPNEIRQSPDFEALKIHEMFGRVALRNLLHTMKKSELKKGVFKRGLKVGSYDSWPD